MQVYCYMSPGMEVLHTDGPAARRQGDPASLGCVCGLLPANRHPVRTRLHPPQHHWNNNSRVRLVRHPVCLSKLCSKDSVAL